MGHHQSINVLHKQWHTHHNQLSWFVQPLAESGHLFSCFAVFVKDQLSVAWLVVLK